MGFAPAQGVVGMSVINPRPAAHAIGIDFGTTNSVIATAGTGKKTALVSFAAPQGPTDVFRSALCFWQDDALRSGLGHEAGPWAIAEFLDFPEGSRFIQSFKSLAADALFETASLFGKRLRFEELGQIFMAHLITHASEALADLPDRIVVGRPVRYAGARPDPALARARYDAMFAALGREIHYVYEPMGAAFGFASNLDDPATLLVADFGGGTSDFSVVRVAERGAPRRCIPLGSAGIGIAGDTFDYRLMDRLVLPLLGKGGTYRSFDKVLEIPAGYYSDFGDWSRLALMRNRRTLADLSRLQHSATNPSAIARMIAVIENELGNPLYEAIGLVKRTLSSETHAEFIFDAPGLSINAQVDRGDFESWIAEDLQRIEQTVDAALDRAGVAPKEIDHVFLTGGSSQIPAVRKLFEQRFGYGRIMRGNELTSIAHGLGLMAAEADLAGWAIDDEKR